MVANIQHSTGGDGAGAARRGRGLQLLATEISEDSPSVLQHLFTLAITPGLNLMKISTLNKYFDE